MQTTKETVITMDEGDVVVIRGVKSEFTITYDISPHKLNPNHPPQLEITTRNTVVVEFGEIEDREGDTFINKDADESIIGLIILNH